MAVRWLLLMRQWLLRLQELNSVFEIDFAVRLVLIAGNDVNVYLNASTDPYSGSGSYNSELANTLDANLNDSDYDIGHLYAGSGDGGNAGCIRLCLCKRKCFF